MSSGEPMMRAIYQDDYGDVDSFKLGTLPKPTPGDGEVLVQVHAAGVNPVDITRSSFMKGETFPIVGGYDVAGAIAAVGSGDVGELKVGDRIVAEVTGGAPEGVHTPKSNGSFAELCALKANLCAVVPKDASFVDMAAIPVAVGTAVQAFDFLGLSTGHRIFISGGAGGVGIHAMQIAKSVFGAAEVATTASAGKFDFVKQWGADRVVDYKMEDAGEVLKGWADVVLDCTYEVPMCKKIAKEGGKICSILQFDHEDAAPINLSTSNKLMARLCKMYADGKFKVVIDKVYSLDEGIKALEHVAGGRAKGKVVIKVRE